MFGVDMLWKCFVRVWLNVFFACACCPLQKDSFFLYDHGVWAEEGPADFEVAQKDPKWSHQSGLRSPFWLLCEHWHFNLPVEISAHLPVRHTEEHMAICHSFSLYREKKGSPQHFLVFFCCFLDSRKKNKTEKEATFLYWNVLGLKITKREEEGKLGYTIFSHCRRS